MVEIIFLIIAGIFMTAAIGIGFLIIFGNFFIVMLQPVAERINSYLLRFNLRKVNPGYIKILEKYFYYYKNLTPAYQRRFEQRVRVFITSKKFISKDMETVTEEMKVLIAASAIQLTFGLSLFTLTHFIKIIVHPDSYHYSPRSKVKFQGHVTGRSISFSWKHFKEGYVDLTDGLNTGLHEMAHALINNFIRENFSFKFYDSYEVWEEIADSEIIKIRHKENKFLRPYAGTNTDELFAVAAEAFFEIPQEFEKQMPAMYEQLKVLFKQDPSNKAEPMLN